MENINWLGHASFFFLDENGKRVYFIDPFNLKDKILEKADLIFITHAHYDHFSQKDIDKIIKNNTVIVATLDVLEKINISNDRKIKVEPNKEYLINEFKFSTIPAYNKSLERLSFHPKENNWVGFIFNLNGKKIYHSGDTDFIDEMKNLKNLNLDVAMLPIGGTYTMDVEEAALAANEIKAKITIPMHYKNLLGEKHKEEAQKFKKLVIVSEVLILEELN